MSFLSIYRVLFCLFFFLIVLLNWKSRNIIFVEYNLVVFGKDFYKVIIDKFIEKGLEI